jgi:hypothetical protein
VQTFVLSVTATGAEATRQAVDDGIRRVEAHYAPMWKHGPTRASHVSPTVGMVLWETEDSPSLWPAWAERPDEVFASLYAPLGVERVVGTVPLEQAPFDLARELRRSPHRMLEVAAPFVCASHIEASDTVDVFTDAVGVGRLFETRTPTGWVWSNRPVAALLFAGLPLVADPEGWQQVAVVDEMFGHTTPYKGVRALEPATHVHWDGHARRRHVAVVDTSATWVPTVTSSDGPSRDQLDAAAADLRGVAASVSRLYKGTPVVQLTGGRDSRMVAAAFIASGSDLVLHTHDAWPGDLDVAKRLVELAPGNLEHRVEHVATGGQVDPPPFSVVEAARRWHDYAEGLRPCSYLTATVPSHLDANTEVIIGGVGGEAAHGFFYPGNLAKLEKLPVEAQLEAFASRVLASQARVPGATAEARAHVTHQVLSVLRRISSWGVRGGTILDQYYVLQRMRRWGTTGERLGIVSPLLASSFLTAALSLSPQDRRKNIFQRELTRRLLPAWADVPYFPGEMREAVAHMPKPRPARVIRLAEAEDRAELESLLADTKDWGAPFETDEVHRLWHLSVSGETNAYQERVLRAAVWRASFTDHLRGLSGQGARERPLATVPVPPEPEPVATVASGPRPERRGLARPAARALAGTRVWQKTRNTALGRLVRSFAARLK